MENLLTAIVLWLSANFGLPASFDFPRIEMRPPREIVALRYRGLASAQQPGVPPSGPSSAEILAIYDDAARTIYLPENWRGRSPAELSILVHEMVHHLQNVGSLKFECPQAREQVAYQAQEKWLGLFGRDLARDFELDPLSVFVKTRCLL